MKKKKTKNIRISLKNYIVAFTIFVVLVLAALFMQNLRSIKHQNAQLTQVESVNLKNINNLSKLSYLLEKLVTEQRNHIIANTDGSRYNAERRIAEINLQTEDLLLKLQHDLQTHEELDIFDFFKRDYKAFHDLNHTVISLSNQNQDSTAYVLAMNEGQNLLFDLETKVENLRLINLEQAESNRKQAAKTTAYSTLVFIAVGGFLIIIIVLFSAFLFSRLNIPVKDLRYALGVMNYGDIPDDKLNERADEIGQLAQLTNSLAEYLQNVKKFVQEIGEERFDTQIDIKHGLGTFGNELINMRNSIINVLKEYRQQKKEEKGRNWATHGYAKFGDLMRKYQHNLDDLYEVFTGEMIQYMDAIQGAMFLVRNDNPDENSNSHFDENGNENQDYYLEMVAAYAYQRTTIANQRIEAGEGLVGRCALEREPIYITDVPEEHFKIGSGLGESLPTSILIVPLMHNRHLLGILEIAAFITFEPYQIDFAVNVGEVIASTIASVRSGIKTAQLLEQSQKQAEDMQEQEQTMRENLEKLKATQEESDRREREAIGFQDAVNHTVIRADFSIQGLLMYANTKFYEVMGYTSREAEGRHVSMFLYENDRHEFSIIWERLAKGGRHFEREVHYKTKNGSVWLFVTYTVVRNRDGTVNKILFLAIDINKRKLKMNEQLGMLKGVDMSYLKAEITPDGSLIRANDLLCNLLGYQPDEIKNRRIFDFLNTETVPEMKKHWRSLINGNFHENTLQFMSRNNEKLWFHVTFSPIINYEKNTYKIVLLANDVTRLVQMENEYRVCENKLKRQKEEINTYIGKIEELNEKVRIAAVERKQKETAIKMVYEEMFTKLKIENKQLEKELNKYKNKSNK